MLEHIDDARKFHGHNQAKAADFDVVDREQTGTVWEGG